jgi:DNA repair exonuclease SbcCD ATPase subunit
MDTEEEINFGTEEPSTLARILPIVVLSLLALTIGMTVYLFLDLRSTKAEFSAQTKQLQIHEEQIAQLEGSVNRATRTVDSSVEELKGVVASAEKSVAEAAQQVERRVLGRTDTLAKRLDEQKAERDAKLSEVGGEIAKLSEVTSSTDNKLGSLTGTVDEVKVDVAETKAALEKTISDLSSVKGDLGVQSGLIATNAGEVQALRELGERNYYEFDLTKTKQPQRIGSIQIKLKRVDQKRNKFTVDIWADDKRIEKKNKTLLEPIQFYVIGSRQPYEIVVNKLERNRISGYLATPKVQKRRTTTASASGS